jgi:hypothetical protein
MINISQADKCGEEWASNDWCDCQGKVYFGTWSSIMLDKEQKYNMQEVKAGIQCSQDNFDFGENGPLMPDLKKECYCEHE